MNMTSAAMQMLENDRKAQRKASVREHLRLATHAYVIATSSYDTCSTTPHEKRRKLGETACNVDMSTLKHVAPSRARRLARRAAERHND